MGLDDHVFFPAMIGSDYGTVPGKPKKKFPLLKIHNTKTTIRI